MSAIGRVLLVDMHVGFREAATAALRRRGLPCDALADPRKAAEALRRGAHDVLVVDVGSASNRRMLTDVAWPVAPTVVAVTGRASADGAVAALRARAVDYLTKPVHTAVLVESIRRARQRARAVRSVHRAGRLIARCAEWMHLLDVILAAPGPAALPTPLLTALARERLSTDAGEGAPTSVLSPREHEVLLVFASGLRVRQIARTLGISIHTARAHLKAIMRKLNVHSQTALVERLRVPWRSDTTAPGNV